MSKIAPTAMRQALADGPSPAYGSKGVRIWPVERQSGLRVTVMRPSSSQEPSIFISMRLVYTSAFDHSSDVGCERTTRTKPSKGTVYSPTPGTAKVSTEVMPRLSMPGTGGVQGVTWVPEYRLGTPSVVTGRP